MNQKGEYEMKKVKQLDIFEYHLNANGEVEVQEHPDNIVVFFSGGKSSFAVADYAKQTYPNANIVLLFTDTRWEDTDLYRFINEGSDKLQLPMLTLSMGLNPIELMFEKKLVFNSMIGDCSKILKMKVAADFMKKGRLPEHAEWRNKQYLKNEDFTKNAKLMFGIGWEESHREGPIVKNWAPYDVEMPMMNLMIDTDEVLEKYAIKTPELYLDGFSHNNCGGRCVKAGQSHYLRLKEKRPAVFKKLMEQEHHIKMYVSAYRYITDDTVPEEDQIPLHVQERMLSELDDSYRDYFYGRSQKPKLFIHPAASAAPRYSEIKQYAFMKKTVMGETYPYPLRELKFDADGKPFDSYQTKEEKIRARKAEEAEKDQVSIFDHIDENGIDLADEGGCGCFFDFDKACGL